MRKVRHKNSKRPHSLVRGAATTTADVHGMAFAHSLGKREAVSFPEDVGIKTPKAVFHESPPARSSRQLSHTKRAAAVPNFIQ